MRSKIYLVEVGGGGGFKKRKERKNEGKKRKETKFRENINEISRLITDGQTDG